ncbi:protein of unknown function [Trichlorobacter ammonificans]|uniref:Uncharacterized protein n=1 Tax=Trichlorobacter ammonificans TaxID=2916410 RepID=A0ABN8HIK3_9BACT|nr:protein of unknown function [Trichlorobacter ammonificans]
MILIFKLRACTATVKYNSNDYGFHLIALSRPEWYCPPRIMEI